MNTAHEIATRAIGGTVSVAIIRDHSDGTAHFSVCYESRASYWLSRHRFPELCSAQAGALALAEFLGAELRL
jgi:hypothetical protein